MAGRTVEHAPASIGLADVAGVRALLIAAARAGTPLCYADLLGAMGHGFTRPKMRAVCRTLDAIDAAARASGEPDLAVLVVRQSDGLPGQGWWAGEPTRASSYDGPWRGSEARRHVGALQARAFAYWSSAASDGATGGNPFDPASDAQM